MLQQAINYLYAHDTQIWALVAGLVLSWLVTQPLKFAVPAKWTYHARELAAQGIAFVAGFLSTWWLWPLPSDGERSGALVAGLLVGLGSPYAWSILVFLLGLRFPEVKDLLSQDVRRGRVLSAPKD